MERLGAAIEITADRGQPKLQIFATGSAVEGKSNSAAGLVIMTGEVIIHRWYAVTGVLSNSFQTEKIAMEKPCCG